MEDRCESNLSISVAYHGSNHFFHMPVGAKLSQLGQAIEENIGVSFSTQRLILPSSFDRRHRVNNMHRMSDPSQSELTLLQAGIREGDTLQLFGATKADLEFLSSSQNTSIRMRSFEEEDRRAQQVRRGVFSQPASSLPKGPYTFHEFATWKLPAIKLTPSPEKALKLMHRLASDPGVVAVMNKHKWSVGIMTELAPEGYVGVSPSCILGFNKNQGEEISLRLRTDDLLGFRKYDSIRKTLLHELAHMVHSEHNIEFKTLNSQLNKEAEALDWTRSSGHTLHGGSRKIEIGSDSDDGSDGQKEAYRIGGIAPDAGSVREAVALATWKRFQDATVSVSRSSTPQSVDQNDIEVAEVSIQDEAKSDVDMAPSELVKLDSMDLPSPWALNPEPPGNSVIGIQEAADTFDTVRVLDEPLEGIGALTKGINDAAEMDIESDSEIGRMQSAASDVSGKIWSAIENLKAEAEFSDVSVALESIATIFRNVLNHPLEGKYRKIRKSNSTFMRRIGRFPGAVEILKAAGFGDNAQNEEVFQVQRDDPGLMWLALSLVENGR